MALPQTWVITKISHLYWDITETYIPVRGRIKGKTGLYGRFYQAITKLLPSRQIVHSTHKAVYLAPANIHINHLLVHSGWVSLITGMEKGLDWTGMEWNNTE